MNLEQEINKNAKEMLDHLMESKFIASFVNVDIETGEYIRDIKEADGLEIDFEIRDSMLSALGEYAGKAANAKSAAEMRAALLAVHTICESKAELEVLGRNVKNVIAKLGGRE